MTRGGKRAGAGRKPGLFKKQYWMLRIRPEHVKFITSLAKEEKMTIGDLVAGSVYFYARQKKKGVLHSKDASSS
jgi:hypothetical protein